MIIVDDVIFYSMLTIEEIEERFKDIDLFLGIISGHEDVLFTPHFTTVDSIQDT